MTPPEQPAHAPLLSGEAMRRVEGEHVRALRERPSKEDAAIGFIGLAFSGGGIRSATFNLGILQALAKQNMLPQFDYLSTVSGGGYIGSWFSALRHRLGNLDRVRTALTTRQETGEEEPPLRFLRRYSNYLTPKTGLSGDTLAAIATYLRNFGLNLIPLVALGAAFIFAMYLLAQGTAGVDAWVSGVSGLWLALALIMLAVWGAAAGLSTASGTRAGSWAERPAWAWAILLPTGGAGILIALAMMHGNTEYLSGTQWVLFGAVAYGLAWVSGYVIWNCYGAAPEESFRGLFNKLLLIVMTLLAGAVAGFLLGVVDGVVRNLPGADTEGMQQAWWTMALGSPLVMLSFSVPVALHIGLLSRLLSHEAREWWSRIGGLLLAAALAWLIAFALTGLAPVLAIWARGWTVEAGGAWAALTLVGVWLAKSPLTGSGKPGGKDDNKGRRWLDLAVRATPYIFLIGFSIALSALVYFLFVGQSCPACEFVAPIEERTFITACPACLETKLVARNFFAIAHDVFGNMGRFETVYLLIGFVGCVGVFLLAAWRIDINLFSLHHFYRNRLVRAYLGASNYPNRKSHPFTGFSPDDDVRMCLLRDQRPFHIINAALNFSGGDELAWQTRRAGSFTFTPLYCGFEYRATRTTSGVEQMPRTLGGYRPTASYQSRWGTFLGSAMSISGAAASPLAGYHTSAPLAALMTIFNVRLGQWLGNPGDATAWKSSSPTFGARYLLKELTATANTNARFLYLSDGGHFENLGLYELVRRGCRLIVACDAGCDPDYAFDDLGNALRKCSIDLGAEIDIDLTPLRPGNAFKHTKVHHAVGRIHYPDGNEGVLLYVKASLTGGEAPDILNYATNHKAFPHDTTADQAFDEDQFESYRKLGFHIGDELFGAIRVATEAVNGSFTTAAFVAQVASMAIAPQGSGNGA
ncbi:MAG: patatin-like phospholipase family protein [Propionivibrio sp.]